MLGQSNTFNLPKKGLLFAHLNICSLRYKIHEICGLVESNDIHVLAITEMHLDSSFEDSEDAVHGYNLFRRDRNKHGGGVAIYVQNHIPARECYDLMMNDSMATCIPTTFKTYISQLLLQAA